jgi:hypothetical protein
VPCNVDGGHLCDGAGACVPFIAVRCKDDHSPREILGCTGSVEDNGQELISWSSPFDGGMGSLKGPDGGIEYGHECHGEPTDSAAYCAPGTFCEAIDQGPWFTGHCL